MWGLDDYCFLPFYWGSAQLADHPTIRPSSIHRDDVLKARRRRRPCRLPPANRCH